VKKIRWLYRIGALVGAILLPISAVLATGVPEASATVSGEQYCYLIGSGSDYACLNAWGGGPWVNVETTINIRNNDFTVIIESNGNAELQDTGGNAWSNYCIGDAYNDPGRRDTSLDPCGGNGQPAGWGTQFTYVTSGCPQGSQAFQNLHSRGWLGPPVPWVNGSHFYLNKPTKYCFQNLNYV
jgi:hypothetical protein